MADLWVEVDLDSVKHNYRQILARIKPGCTVMAVVKADGYGLGAVELARALVEEGCSHFAVTTVAEALILRREGIDSTILVLGPSSADDWNSAVQHGIQLTVSQLEWIPQLDRMASEAGAAVQIQLKFETGMGRTGFRPEQMHELASLIAAAKNVEITGAYTHFARAAQRDRNYTRAQYQAFCQCVQSLNELGVDIPSKHVCNSASFLDYPEYHEDMVRIGTLLTGHFPSLMFQNMLDLKDPWVCKARIVHLQKAPKGTYVGYQSIYKTKNDTVLAVIPVGYADGFGVEPKLVPQGIVDLVKIIIKNTASLCGYQLGREKITLRGRTVTVAGKIGMQLTVIDVGSCPCQLGEEVILPVRRTQANPRIPRLYIKNTVIFKKRIIEEGFLSLNTEYFNLQ